LDMNLARAPLQAAALLTSDKKASKALLALLGESKEEAATAVAASRWGSTLHSGLGLLGLEMALMVCLPLMPEGTPERYRVRATALMTDDELTRTVLLKILAESEGEARAELADSCWADAVAEPEHERQRLACDLAVNQ
jgi:hypothetical protein